MMSPPSSSSPLLETKEEWDEIGEGSGGGGGGGEGKLGVSSFAHPPVCPVMYPTSSASP